MNSLPRKPQPTPRGEPAANDDAFEPMVLAWRPLSEWSDVCAQVIRSDANVAELMLGLVRATAAAAWDEQRLLEVIAEFSFRAFPNASHLLLAERDAAGEMHLLIARSREPGDARRVLPSRTIAERVVRDGCALLYTNDQGGTQPTASVVLTRLETAICAPLMGRGAAFGVLQLDVRRPARGRFTREDVDLLSVFASQVGLALAHLRVLQQQKRAFHSMLAALVHALAIRNPENAAHSERVRAFAEGIGRRLGLSGSRLETLSVAALLHDLGSEGLRHEQLIRHESGAAPARPEGAFGATETQSILDLIQYPEDLRDVPRVATYHRLQPALDAPGDPDVDSDIRLMARIIAVADLCDGLLSVRVQGDALPPEVVLEILARGRDVDWDGRVVDATFAAFHELMADVYGAKPSPPAGSGEPGPGEGRNAA